MGASEEYLSAIFADARRRAPCMIIMDDLHAVFAARDGHNETHYTVTIVSPTHEFLASRSFHLVFSSQLVSQLLQELDALASGVAVVAATADPTLLDAALLRPGRLEQVWLHCLSSPPCSLLPTPCSSHGIHTLS